MHSLAQHAFSITACAQKRTHSHHNIHNDYTCYSFDNTLIEQPITILYHRLMPNGINNHTNSVEGR
jgi:hypothetical protein